MNPGKHYFEYTHDKITLVDDEIDWNNTWTSVLLKSNQASDKFAQ
jgi:hypothetical protein